MPITFTQVNSLPDTLSSNRHQVLFPSFDGVDGQLLGMVYTHVTLPQKGQGQIVVKILDHSIGFRGGINFDNQLTITFYEMSDGSVLRSLENWKKLVRNEDDTTSKHKQDYAKNLEITVYNTVGEAALKYTAIGVYPLEIQYPELGEDSAPMEISVTFNCDDLKRIN